MAGISATEAHSNLYRLIDETAESHQPRIGTWKLVYTKQAQEDAKKLASSGLKPEARERLALLAEDPFRKPPV